MCYCYAAEEYPIVVKHILLPIELNKSVLLHIYVDVRVNNFVLH